MKFVSLAAATVAAALAVCAPCVSFAFTTPTVISTANRQSGAPQVTAYGNGRALIVWKEIEDGIFRIKLRQAFADSTLGPIQTLSSATQRADLPQVAVNALGDAVVVWKQFNGSNWVIEARARAASGALSAVQPLSDPGQNADMPQVAIDPTGKALVVWKRFNGTNQVMQLRQRSPGGALGAVRQISAIGENTTTPLVTMANDGSALLLWDRVEPGKLYSIESRSRAANGALGSITMLAGSFGSPSNASVRMLGDGRALVFWREGSGHMAFRTRSAAGTFGSTEMIATAMGESPRLALAPDFSSVFTWRQQEFSGNTPLRAVSRSPTGVLTDNGTLSTIGRRVEVDYALTIDAQRTAVAFWYETNDTGNGVLRATSRPAGGSFGPSKVVAPKGLFPLNLHAAISAGKAYLVFLAQGAQKSVIQLSRGP
jgi:hypothetical protein